MTYRSIGWPGVPVKDSFGKTEVKIKAKSTVYPQFTASGTLTLEMLRP